MKLRGDGWEQMPLLEVPRTKVVRGRRDAGQTRCKGKRCMKMHSCRDGFGRFLDLCPQCQTEATMKRFKAS